MRERCFAVLGTAVIEAKVLDLFSGTGAVGIEALSRGAATAIFVESHRSAAKLIRSNLESLGIDDERVSVLNRPAAKAVSELARRGQSFDLIWADPPFEIWREGLDVLIAIVEAGLATRESILCLECPAEADVETALPTSLVVRRDLKGGASRVVILRRK